jgi:endonuclease/exonuclease/phosphatase family metal-dependent hydrolase
MSYNIRHGEGIDTILDLSRSAKIIKSYTPDICALQEVDNFCLRSNNIGQTDYFAQQTMMTGTFGGFMKFQGGEYGMATLSLKPLISTNVLQLPDGKHEPRTSIVHEVQISQEHTIIFANVHFDWISGKEGDFSRLKQAKALTKYINTLNKAAIITGDFNSSPNSKTMKHFAEQGFIFVEKGEDNLSFQGENKVEIDHLIYRNTDSVKFKTKSIKLIEEPVISDHRPLIVELIVVFN